MTGCKPEDGVWAEGYECGYADGENSGDATAWNMVSEALGSDEDWPELLEEIRRLVQERDYPDPKYSE